MERGSNGFDRGMSLDQMMQECSIDFWDMKVGREILQNEYSEWIREIANWQLFLTLTFRHPIGEERALGVLYAFIHGLNKKTFGKRYRRKVGRSYFSFVHAIEYQKRDVIHFHALIDKRIPIRFARALWEKWAGFIYIEKIKNKRDVTSYVSKYVLKGGQISVYLSDYNGMVPEELF